MQGIDELTDQHTYYCYAGHGISRINAAKAPGALWKMVWPTLLGAIAFIIVRRLKRLPGSVPEGDIVTLAEAGSPLVRRLAADIEQAVTRLRRWPVAGLWLAGLAVLLGGALMLRARPEAASFTHPLDIASIRIRAPVTAHASSKSQGGRSRLPTNLIVGCADTRLAGAGMATGTLRFVEKAPLADALLAFKAGPSLVPRVPRTSAPEDPVDLQI
jgi:hypothetical protein